ncbi:MAG: hypothetical protein ACI8WB_003568 [Phenylobacterium sp.]|jgi:hypothetical protein
MPASLGAGIFFGFFGEDNQITAVGWRRAKGETHQNLAINGDILPLSQTNDGFRWRSTPSYGSYRTINLDLPQPLLFPHQYPHHPKQIPFASCACIPHNVIALLCFTNTLTKTAQNTK